MLFRHRPLAVVGARAFALGLMTISMSGSMGISALAASNAPPYVPAPASIALRMPTASDDGAHGEPVGSFWTFSGTLYQSVDATAGNAVWQPTNSQSIYPAQAAAWSDAWGTRKMTETYTAGKAFDLTRSSDNTVLTVTFVSDRADTTAADLFCAATVCRYTQIYDQIGTNNLVIPVATAPEYKTGIFTGNAPSIIMDTNLFGTGYSPGQASEAIPVPAGVTTNAAAVSWGFVGRLTDGGLDNPLIDLYMTANGNSAYDTWLTCLPESASRGLALGYINVYAAQTSLACPISPSFFAFTMSASGVLMALDTTQVTSGTVGGYSGFIYNGGQIGAGREANQGVGYIELSGIMARSAISTAADFTATAGAVDLGFGIVPQKEANVVEYGDSIVAGVGASDLETGPRQILGQVHGPIRLASSGYSGATLASLVGNLPGWAANNFDPNASQNIWLGEAGTNDLSGSTTDVQLEALELQESKTVIGLGFKFVAMTVIPRLGLTTAQNAYRLSYNSWMRANWPTFASALDDLDANVEINADMGQSSFSPDTTHLTSRGYLAHATTDAAAIDQLLGH